MNKKYQIHQVCFSECWKSSNQIYTFNMTHKINYYDLTKRLSQLITLNSFDNWTVEKDLKVEESPLPSKKIVSLQWRNSRRFFHGSQRKRKGCSRWIYRVHILNLRASLQGVSFVDAEDAGISVPSNLVYTDAIKLDAGRCDEDSPARQRASATRWHGEHGSPNGNSAGRWTITRPSTYPPPFLDRIHGILFRDEFKGHLSARSSFLSFRFLSVWGSECPETCEITILSPSASLTHHPLREAKYFVFGEPAECQGKTISTGFQGWIVRGLSRILDDAMSIAKDRRRVDPFLIDSRTRERFRRRRQRIHFEEMDLII